MPNPEGLMSLLPLNARTFTKNILSIITGRPRDDCGFNTDDGNLVIGHALTILNTLMGEIEKNIYYDIALLANQSGISGNRFRI